MERLLSKREKNILGSKEYRDILNRELAKLYIEAEEWMSARGIENFKYPEKSGFVYYTQAGYCKDEKLNTRARNEELPVEITIIKKYYEKGGQSYSASGVWRKEVDTDAVFIEANKAIYG